MFPEPTAATFEMAASLGYDGIEVMVWTDAVSQDLGALRLVRDPVQGEQVDDVALLEPDATQLQTADLGVRGADGVAGLLAVDTGSLTEPPQLRAEHDARDGGTVVLARTRRGHRRRPPTR